MAIFSLALSVTALRTPGAHTFGATAADATLTGGDYDSDNDGIPDTSDKDDNGNGIDDDTEHGDDHL